MWPIPPHSALNPEEQALLNHQPEECLRRAVQRGALSTEQIGAGLSPRLHTVLQAVVSGERPPLPPEPAASHSGSRQEHRVHPAIREIERQSLSVYPTLLALVDEQDLSTREALEVAHAVDDLLGRYPTGARYAAP